MTALHSLISDYWTGGVSPMTKQAVRLYCCMRLKLNASLVLVFNEVWGHDFTWIMWCPHTLQWPWRLAVDLCLLNAWNGGCVGPGRAACTFVLLCVWSIAVEGVVGFWYSMTSYFTLTCYFAVQMHYVSSCWPWTNSAYVCISVCICSNLKVLLIGVRCSMVFRFHPCVSFCCPTVMTALRLSLFLAECVERSDVVLALNQQWWCMTTPCWSSLIECMERPAVVLALYKQIVRFCRCCSYVSLTTLEGVT